MAADKDKQLVAQNGGEEGEGPVKKKMAGKQLVLFIILPALLVLGGGGAAAYFFIFKKPPAAEGSAEAGKEKGEKKKDKKDKKEGKKGEKKAEDGGVTFAEGPNGEGFMTMPPITVNITTADSRPAYLKLRLTLQAADMETAEGLEPMMPVIMDQYTGFLRELRMEDLAGSAGYARLQNELLKRVNLAVAPAQIQAVLIEEMLVQ
jgi:flagellar protein FliL